MPELSLAAEVLRLVRQAAMREGFERVARLRQEAGALSGVQASALHFALQAIGSRLTDRGSGPKARPAQSAAACAGAKP